MEMLFVLGLSFWQIEADEVLVRLAIGFQESDHMCS